MTPTIRFPSAKPPAPRFRAEVFGEGGEQASYTTGKWSSSDTLIATINEDTGVVATTGTKVGAVTFTFTADNGTEDATDDVTGESEPYTVTAGDSLALVIPGGSSIVTRVNQPATVLWSSNAALMAPDKEFNYRIDLYEGNYANEAALSGLNPVATYTAGKDKNSVRIEENVLSRLSNGDTPAYTVLVSMPHPNAEGENVRLSALAWIIVQAPPATAKLTPPQSIYLTDTDSAVNIDWSVENATDGRLSTAHADHYPGHRGQHHPRGGQREPIRYLRKLLPVIAECEGRQSKGHLSSGFERGEPW